MVIDVFLGLTVNWLSTPLVFKFPCYRSLGWRSRVRGKIAFVSEKLFGKTPVGRVGESICLRINKNKQVFLQRDVDLRLAIHFPTYVSINR